MANRLKPNAEPSAALQALVARAERALEGALPPAELSPTQLHRAMRYAALGGKRVRPVLVYATAAALGEDRPSLDAPACAVELIHAYSLVHDDLPAMDDDGMRRGRPTCHVVFGEAMAVLAGDALQARAFELLGTPIADATATRKHADTCAAMLQTLGHACGSEGMAGGQALDLNAVGRRLSVDELEHMHGCKTGALIRASVRLGALAAGADAATLARLDRYADALGLAFQIRDDILDVEGDPAVIGKTAGKDAAADKPTFPSLMGLDASRARLRNLTAMSMEAVEPLGPAAALLRELAHFAAERQS